MLFFLFRKSQKNNHRQRLELFSESYLCQWSKTVGRAASIRNNVNIWLVFLLVNTHNKHRSVTAWSRNDDLLGTTLFIIQAKESNHQPQNHPNSPTHLTNLTWFIFFKFSYLQMQGSFVLISENTSGLNHIFGSSLTPWDLLRVPRQWKKEDNIINWGSKSLSIQKKHEENYPHYFAPKTVTALSPKRRVLESFTLMSWCFHWPWTESYLNM